MIKKEDIVHYFRCLKSKTNDPLDWVNKSPLSEEKFNLMNKLFDDLVLIQENRMDTSDEIKRIEAIKSFFENEKVFEYFNKETENAIKQNFFFKRTCFERFLVFLNRR